MKPNGLFSAALGSLVLAAAMAGARAEDAPAPPTAPVKGHADINRALQKFTVAVSQFKKDHPEGVTQEQVNQEVQVAAKAANLKMVEDPRVAAVINRLFGKPTPQAAAPAGAPAAPADGSGAANPNPEPGKSPPLNFAQELTNAVNNANVAANPGSPEALRLRGISRGYQGDWRGAFSDLGRVVQAGNPAAQTLAAYGAAAYHLGDYRTAASAARAALALDPQNREAMTIYQFTREHGLKVALPSHLGELAADPSGEATPVPSNGLPGQGGDAVFVGIPPPSGMTAEQAAALARQASAPGSDAPARSMQFTKDAAGALRARDYPTAFRLASQAVVLNPQNAQALNFRAMSLGQMRRYSEAVQDASAALGLAPGNAAILHTRSWAFSKKKEYKEALQDARDASATEPSNASLYQDTAFALAGLGDRRGALDALRRSAELDPRFTARLERAVQLPEDADMTLLFDDGSAAAVVSPPPPAGSRSRRFLRLAVLSTAGGLLIALGVLHVVSASWRERVRMTVRRALGPSPASAMDAAGVASSRGSFWTQYELIKEIGLGGMGVVYEATDRSLERRVAVKKMRDEIRLDPQDRRRFVNEARFVAQLHHPGIVDIYGIVEDGADVYLVFEFVEGRTLLDALKSGGAMDLPRARGVIKEIADAVEHAHGRGIIHRDLKPSNVMLTPEGRVKVMDFGIARQAKDALTRHSMTNTIVGTPPYMAPEQEQGTVRKESDVYALGVCLYEMTTGFLPFAGSGAGMLLNKLNGKLIPACRRNAALPAGLDAVLARALEPNPDKRYRTPAELVAAIDALLAPSV